MKTLLIVASLALLMSACKNGEEVSAHLKKEAAKGNGGALYKKGQIHLRKKEWKEAFTCFSGAAKQGFPRSAYNAGTLLITGRGTARNIPEAIRMFKIAAEQDHTGAQMALSRCYSQGIGVTRDPAQAVAWNMKAAKNGDAFAEYHLSMRYHRGVGVPKDMKKCLFWLTKSAEQGRIDAVYTLADYYLQKEFRNLPLAEKWAKKAEELKHPKAAELLKKVRDIKSHPKT